MAAPIGNSERRSPFTQGSTALVLIAVLAVVVMPAIGTQRWLSPGASVDTAMFVPFPGEDQVLVAALVEVESWRSAMIGIRDEVPGADLAGVWVGKQSDVNRIQDALSAESHLSLDSATEFLERHSDLLASPLAENPIRDSSWFFAVWDITACSLLPPAAEQLPIVMSDAVGREHRRELATFVPTQALLSSDPYVPDGCSALLG